jgi:ABC-type glycerol-3-phosphate transport system permease component
MIPARQARSSAFIRAQSQRASQRQSILDKGTIYVLLIIGALVFTLPLVIMVFTSFKSYSEITSYPATFIPNQWVPQNYAEAWSFPNTDFPRWTFNTLFHFAGTPTR